MNMAFVAIKNELHRQAALDNVETQLQIKRFQFKTTSCISKFCIQRLIDPTQNQPATRSQKIYSGNAPSKRRFSQFHSNHSHRIPSSSHAIHPSIMTQSSLRARGEKGWNPNRKRVFETASGLKSKSKGETRSQRRDKKRGTIQGHHIARVLILWSHRVCCLP